MITEAAAFFEDGCGRCDRFATPDCSARLWRDGVLALRRLCLDAGLDEDVRWGHPCYRHAGRNLALIDAFREDFRLSFPDAALLTDPERLLEKPGPNSQTPSMLRFTDAAQVAARAPAIAALLAEAKAMAEAGLKPARAPTEVELPEVLVRALDEDSELAEGFAALTPGRQRSYVIALASAKTEATQIKRIAKYRDKILAGKGANDY
ncbi:YdeI/OmpD-associated family protein [Pararhodobacter sp.]|uniref:YdeI/OmpD-associated family protein n=1 Tax=Pararhodobacter sp. TaxID=2127056 RepID=UPI002AFE2F7E|nr:YdeI/OmpD-associated family protein [Pararhodobacter sp.]